MAMVTRCTPHGGCSRMQRPHLSKVGPRPVGIEFGQERGHGTRQVRGGGGEQTQETIGSS
jgi:hypothetical protein